MKLLHKKNILSGMRMKQNLYRHDGLLATPKGYMINKREKDIIEYYDYEFVLVEQKISNGNGEIDINHILNIIEHVLNNNYLWTPSYGEKLYDLFANVVMKNKNRVKYLNQFSNLNSYELTHYINTAIIVLSILTENKETHLNEKMAEIFFLTLMHEISKNEEIRSAEREGKLTRNQMDEIQKMPEKTAEYMLKMGFNPYELKFLYEINERYDGYGYARVKGEEIEELAQIIAIAKFYDEKSSFTHHNAKEPVKNIYKEMLYENGRTFNPRILKLFFERFKPYEIGDTVELTNGETGEVKFFKSQAKFLPYVQVVNGEHVSLYDLQNEEIEIVKLEEYI